MDLSAPLEVFDEFTPPCCRRQAKADPPKSDDWRCPVCGQLYRSEPVEVAKNMRYWRPIAEVAVLRPAR